MVGQFHQLDSADMAPSWSRSSSPTLARVLAGDLCAGCGLCAAIAPDAVTMRLDSNGYARPFALGQPVAPDQEVRIKSACPGSEIAPWPPSGTPVHPYWGPVKSCGHGHASDDVTRFGGSSGGILSALAIHALTTGMVDAVVHIAADDRSPALNQVRLSTTAEQIQGAAGSRYGPSPLLAELAALLDDPRTFMVIGKPCDISALRQLAKSDPRVDARFRWMLSFFCGGMPSAHGTDAIIAALGMDKADLATFRYRGNGWPGTARAQQSDGRAAQMSYAESWGKYLSSRVQYRCKICPDAVGGSADLAAADAWYGGETGYPQFEERDGRSLVLARTDAGSDLLNSALAADDCQMEHLAIAEIDLMQPAQARRKRLIAARTLAARLMFQPLPVMRGLAVRAAAANAGWLEQAKNLGGALRRIAQGQR